MKKFSYSKNITIQLQQHLDIDFIIISFVMPHVPMNPLSDIQMNY